MEVFLPQIIKRKKEVSQLGRVAAERSKAEKIRCIQARNHNASPMPKLCGK
jgi:hypothetical protein